MNLNDPGNLGRRLERQLAKLDEAVEKGIVTEEEREAILRYLNELEADRDNKGQTNANHLKILRLTTKRSEPTLLEMDKEDINSITVTLLHDHGLKKKTLNNYKSSWKPFFSFLGRDWASEIEFYDIDNDEVDEDKVFSNDEIDAMLEKADGRTTCVIAILADTGMRIQMLLSIPVGNKDFRGDVPVLKLNADAPTKGAEGNIPLTFSRSYIASYLNGDHKRPHRDDVALIHKHEGYDEDDDGALSPKTVREDVKEVMEEVGITEHRQRIHNFRHTAVTNWLRMNMPDQILQHRTKWADMSMKERYSHLVEEDKDEMTAEFFGLIDPKDTDEPTTPEEAVGECPTCTTTIRPGARYCPGCGTPIDPIAAHDLPPEGVQEPQETAEDLEKYQGVLDQMSEAAIVESILRNNPELVDEIELNQDDLR